MARELTTSLKGLSQSSKARPIIVAPPTGQVTCAAVLGLAHVSSTSTLREFSKRAFHGQSLFF